MEMINTMIINFHIKGLWVNALKEIIRRKEPTMIDLFIIYSDIIQFMKNKVL